MGSRFLVLFLFLACATAPPPPTPAGESKEDAWRRARIIEAAVNGCGIPCPNDGLCVDDYGLCWTPCAWQRSDPAMRASLHRAALDADPARSFLLSCPEPRGRVQAAFRPPDRSKR